MFVINGTEVAKVIVLTSVGIATNLGVGKTLINGVQRLAPTFLTVEETAKGKKLVLQIVRTAGVSFAIMLVSALAAKYATNAVEGTLWPTTPNNDII